MSVSRNLNVLCYGGGVNTIAMLLECKERGIVFDAILFADPGSEWQASYEYTKFMNEWCIQNGQPEITIVKQLNKDGEFVGLYNDSLVSQNLPSIAYGFKSCSQKFKRFPQDKYLNNWILSKEAWANGFKVVKWIGFDADESHRTEKIHNDKKYSYEYPLVKWNWGRFECVKRILDAGFSLPPKSSCTFCPSMKPYEIINLYETDRKDFYKAITMERTAAPNLTSVKGLGRSFSWWDLIVAYKYLNMINKYGVSKAIPNHIKKMMKKISNSRPVSKSNKPIEIINDLFSVTTQIACECFDGES